MADKTKETTILRAQEAAKSHYVSRNLGANEYVKAYAMRFDYMLLVASRVDHVLVDQHNCVCTTTCDCVRVKR